MQRLKNECAALTKKLSGLPSRPVPKDRTVPLSQRLAAARSAAVQDKTLLGWLLLEQEVNDLCVELSRAGLTDQLAYFIGDLERLPVFATFGPIQAGNIALV